jgi:hypothetical protein
MNNLNQLEKELQYWIPRAPSARLKARLFPAVPPARPAAGLAAALRAVPWTRFAPAMCVVLLAARLCSNTPSKEAGYFEASGGSNVLASLSANLINFCATNTRAERMNSWTLPPTMRTFDWTSAGHSLTTTDSLPSWKTNIQKL